MTLWQNIQSNQLLTFKVQYLSAVLGQDIIKFSLQMVVDGFSSADFLEFLQQLKGSGREVQSVKRQINKVDDPFVDILKKKESAWQNGGSKQYVNFHKIK